MSTQPMAKCNNYHCVHAGHVSLKQAARQESIDGIACPPSQWQNAIIVTVYMQATSGRGRKPRCRLYTSCLPCWTAVLFKVEDGVRSSGSYLENMFRNALGNLQTSVLGHLCHVQIQQLTQEQCEQEFPIPFSLKHTAGHDRVHWWNCMSTQPMAKLDNYISLCIGHV